MSQKYKYSDSNKVLLDKLNDSDYSILNIFELSKWNCWLLLFKNSMGWSRGLNYLKGTSC